MSLLRKTLKESGYSIHSVQEIPAKPTSYGETPRLVKGAIKADGLDLMLLTQVGGYERLYVQKTLKQSYPYRLALDVNPDDSFQLIILNQSGKKLPCNDLTEGLQKVIASARQIKNIDP